MPQSSGRPARGTCVRPHGVEILEGNKRAEGFTNEEKKDRSGNQFIAHLSYLQTKVSSLRNLPRYRSNRLQYHCGTFGKNSQNSMQHHPHLHFNPAVHVYPMARLSHLQYSSLIHITWQNPNRIFLKTLLARWWILFPCFILKHQKNHLANPPRCFRFPFTPTTQKTHLAKTFVRESMLAVPTPLGGNRFDGVSVWGKAAIQNDCLTKSLPACFVGLVDLVYLGWIELCPCLN